MAEQTRNTYPGTCQLCGGTFAKGSLTAHLKKCREAHPTDDRKSKDAIARPVYHMQVEGDGAPMYWMHIEIPADATMKDLDSFLRETWLECCGHMSAFTIGEETYSAPTEWDEETRPLTARLSEALAPGETFRHEYDFGTTTYLKGRIIGERTVSMREGDVTVLARNLLPEIPCGLCGKPAEVVCGMCSWEAAGWMCKACAGSHGCGSENFLPVVNSPRVGMCAYVGDGEEWPPEEEE